jgi:hypothetical protein
MKGKVVQVFHCYLDYLWALGDQSSASSNDNLPQIQQGLKTSTGSMVEESGENLSEIMAVAVEPSLSHLSLDGEDKHVNEEGPCS